MANPSPGLLVFIQRLLSRRLVLVGGITRFLLAPALGLLAFRNPVTAAASTQADWDEVRTVATRFVRAEIPEGGWPFRQAGSRWAGKVSRHVIAHYFPPFPLSIDNAPAARDAYESELRSPLGERGKHLLTDGYLRDRPLPVGPWPEKSWQCINYAIEIMRARIAGLDGFGVDILTFNGPLWDRVEMLFSVTDAVGDGFRIVLEPDLGAHTDTGPERWAEVIHHLSSHPSIYRLKDGSVLIAPFNADLHPPAFFASLRAALAQLGTQATIWPLFLNEPLYVLRNPGFSGAYAIWDRPDLQHDSPRGELSGARGVDPMLVMQGFSPQHSAPKIALFREARGTAHFRSGWLDAISNGPSTIQLVSWNDYTEGTQISPSLETQYIFYDLTRYYSAYFKNGVAPSIVADCIYYSHRRQLLAGDSRPTSGHPGMRAAGTTRLTNQIEMLAFLTSYATMQIVLPSGTIEKEAGAGLAILTAPAEVCQPRFKVIREGRTVLDIQGAWTIEASFSAEDPEYVGGSSNRAYISLSAQRPGAHQRSPEIKKE